MKPLVLDVDGTVLKTDMLVEAFWAGLGRAPLKTLACLRHIRDIARFKWELARVARLRVDLLPVNSAVLEFARSEPAREVVLASASDLSQVRALARHLGLSERVFASDGVTNLKSRAKARALTRCFGMACFDYAGNSRDDLAVWEMADRAIVVGDFAQAPEGALRISGGQGPLWAGLRLSESWQALFALMPFALAGGAALPAAFAALGVWLIGLSLGLVNDFLSLEADRQDPVRAKRPFASGSAQILHGMLLSKALGGLALICAALAGVLPLIGLYILVGLFAAFRLNRSAPMLANAALALIPIWAGAQAAGVADSPVLALASALVVIGLVALKTRSGRA